MAELNINIEFDVMCQKHNKSLTTDVTKVRGYDIVYVESCDECLEEAENEGYKNGQKEE